MAGKLFTLTATCLSIVCLLRDNQFAAINGLLLQEFTSVELTSQLENSGFQEWPLCIIYKSSSKITNLEKNVVEFLKSLDEESYFRKWSFATIDTRKHFIPPSIHPGLIPSVLCHIGEAAPVRYLDLKPSHKSIKRWFKSVAKSFKNRILPVTFKDLKSWIPEHDGITLVGIPGNLFHLQLEEALKEVAIEWKEAVHLFMIPPSSDDERDLCQKYGVSDLPAVLFFNKREWDDNEHPVQLLQGQLDTGVYQVKLELTVKQATATTLTLGNFEKEVLETKLPKAPMAVTFYSHRNPRSLDYFNILDKTIKQFVKIDSSFQFGTVNLVDNSEDLSQRQGSVNQKQKAHEFLVFRYVNASLVSAVPFTVIFWQNKHRDDSKYVIKQALFNQGIPTAQNLYDFIESENIPLLIDTDADLTWFKEKPEVCDETAHQGNECAITNDNTTDFISQDSLLVQDMATVYGPEPAPSEWKQPIKISASANVSADVRIPMVTDETWSALIEQSVRPHRGYSPQINQGNPYHVSLVVFIKGDCGYCTKVMPVLQEIANSVKMIGVSMYLMNCTTDPLHCSQHGITGYPTLTAFRSLSWSVTEHCFPPNQQSRYIRVDYHGAIVPDIVLDWLSNINQPAVNKKYMDDYLPDDMTDDVYLVATLYTRSLARQYLPSRLIDRWYPYQCYTLVCELLFGLVPCYALYTRDVVDHVGEKRNEKDLILAKLSLQRNDGVHATIFELGYNLAFTLNQESDSRLHMFHEPHRYNVANDFKCEDDHRKCTEYVVQFVGDHRRLPVTQITTAIFHTKTGTEGKRTSDVLTHDLPVMLILARTLNISRDSRFYKEITVAAYSLYQEMVFATLNVDEFSFWASNFVPKNYLTKYAFDSSSSPPSLYHYPRLCIVRWKDHQHAAFYPAVSEMERLGTRVQERLDAIDSQQIIKFARDFLRDSERMVVRTEMF